MRIGLSQPGSSGDGEGARRGGSEDADARATSHGSPSLRVFSEAADVDPTEASPSRESVEAPASQSNTVQAGSCRQGPCSGSGDAQGDAQGGAPGGSIDTSRTRAGGAGRLSPRSGTDFGSSTYESHDILSLCALQPSHDGPSSVAATHGTLSSLLTAKVELERVGEPAETLMGGDVLQGRASSHRNGRTRGAGSSAAAASRESLLADAPQARSASAQDWEPPRAACQATNCDSSRCCCPGDARSGGSRSAGAWSREHRSRHLHQPQSSRAPGSHRSSSRVSPEGDAEDVLRGPEVETTEDDDGARDAVPPGPVAATERGSLHSVLGSLQPGDLLPRNGEMLQLGEDVDEHEEEEEEEDDDEEEEEGEGEEETLPTAISAPDLDRHRMQSDQRAEAAGRSAMLAPETAGGSGNHLRGNNNGSGGGVSWTQPPGAGPGNSWASPMQADPVEERRSRRPSKSWYEGARARREEQGQSPVQGALPERQRRRREPGLVLATSVSPALTTSQRLPSSSTRMARGPVPALPAVRAATPPAAGTGANGSSEVPLSLGHTSRNSEFVALPLEQTPSPMARLQRISNLMQPSPPPLSTTAQSAAAVFQRPPLHGVPPASPIMHLGARSAAQPSHPPPEHSLLHCSISGLRRNSPGARLRSPAAGGGLQPYRLENVAAHGTSAQLSSQGIQRSHSHASRSRSQSESQELLSLSLSQSQSQPQPQSHTLLQSQQSLARSLHQSQSSQQQPLPQAVLQLQAQSQSQSPAQSQSQSQSQPDSSGTGGSKRRRVLMGTDVVDLLECPICIEPMSAPIFQCHNGHTLCNACVRKVEGRCPSCRQPTGSIRNLALERFAASLVVSCSHEGCSVMLPMQRVEEHEAQCLLRPLPCPEADDGCAETFGTEGLLCLHLMACHGASLTDLSREPATRSATCAPIVIPPGRKFSILRLPPSEGSPSSSTSSSPPQGSRVAHALVVSRARPKGCTLGVLLDAPSGGDAPGWRFSLHVSTSPDDLAKPATCSSLSGSATDLRSACLGTRAPVELVVPLDSDTQMLWIKLQVQGCH